jgi:DNA-binding IclR family transcriptional regulator
MQAQFGSRTDFLLIGAAVYLSTIEGRPLTASKLADYVGMPRASVIRKLRTLIRRGAIERNGKVYCTPTNRLAALRLDDHAALVKLVQASAGHLR